MGDGLARRWRCRDGWLHNWRRNDDAHDDCSGDEFFTHVIECRAHHDDDDRRRSRHRSGETLLLGVH